MTPQKKAQELIDKFTFEIGNFNAKQGALICVNEIMHVIDWHEFETPNEELNYWNQVKEEIKQL